MAKPFSQIGTTQRYRKQSDLQTPSTPLSSPLINQNLVRIVAHRQVKATRLCNLSLLRKTTMKFNTCQDKSLKDNSSPVKILVHENKHIPDKHTSTSGLGRCEFMEPTVFFTPVLSSERVNATKRPDLVSVDDLVKDLGKLLISDDTKTGNNGAKEDEHSENDKKKTPSKADGLKTPSPHVVRLLQETPEAFDEKLGRCVQSAIDETTFQVTHVTRSLRLKA